jgi:hypothetical protein
VSDTGSPEPLVFLKIILILNLEEKNLAGQEKKIYSDLTFSQYNHILAIFTV